ncbi:putative esterase [Sinorhizobium meliloti]
MIGILGLHGSSQHPELISEFTNRLAPQQPGCSPRGIFVDGEGFSFFKRRSDRSIPHEELIALARESLSATGFVLACGLKDMLVVGYSSGALFGTALLALAPFSKDTDYFGRAINNGWSISASMISIGWWPA